MSARARRRGTTRTLGLAVAGLAGVLAPLLTRLRERRHGLVAVPSAGPRPRLTMVTTQAHPDLGGIESHVAEVAGRLAARGWDLEVLTTDRTGRLPRAERHDGYLVRRYAAYPRNRDWFASPGLLLALLHRRHELVHVQGVHTLVPPVAMLGALLRRSPYLLTFHSGGATSDLRARARSTQWRLLGPLLRRARVLIGVSDYEVSRFEEATGAPVRLVRNGGSLPEPEPRPQVEPGLVVSVGRLERYKGHHRAIAALPALVRRRPDARLEILGAGPYEAELRSLAADLGVADRVSIRFVQPADRVGMARAVAAAGCVVLLSDYEAHPVAVMEGLALSRPVVVARTSGLTELGERGWARTVEADAPAADVAEVIAAQLEDPLVPEVSDLPTWEGCVDALEVAYADALGRPVEAVPPVTTAHAAAHRR
ncbi:glycosyltransferase family 4 protein [Nocardioides bruguierae]|uniref:glycosyltransferase family 4 protein n=1 Tax=Nocardioides bruguierae TaxID=2945102 RepID=UPI0020221C61|nr:glycosyltransferase family 4 protein [Nocardioides bruguierae]MCL8024431.1 glycosyltransferase family 4 protein [Nocardioides bruguierae]